MEGYNRQCLGVYGAPWRGGVVICRVRKPVILVRSWLQADIQPPEIDFRLTPNIGHSEAHAGLPVLTPNGLSVHIGQALVLDTGGGESRGHGFLRASED